MFSLLFPLWTKSQQVCADGKGKTVSHQPLILQWEGFSADLAVLILLCPFLYIFYHTLFSTIHLCFHSWFCSSMLHPHLLSNSHFVEDTAVFFSLLPSNPAPSLQSFVVYISVHLNASLGPPLIIPDRQFSMLHPASPLPKDFWYCISLPYIVVLEVSHSPQNDSLLELSV